VIHLRTDIAALVVRLLQVYIFFILTSCNSQLDTTFVPIADQVYSLDTVTATNPVTYSEDVYIVKESELLKAGVKESFRDTTSNGAIIRGFGTQGGITYQLIEIQLPLIDTDSILPAQ
jgi:hypothetical protein